ncbi:MAG: NYN domain-containing protein [Gammaproteobacteria bacterium]|nr:NYN domain-containing protein [Gammaproteobacteria bacterium]MYG12473.1 NYN domain-containing protein [Gammaproteobacteria bacterium]MYK28326.1 NYN domain-containing protein [Gammaproteobacteria bacterium]
MTAEIQAGQVALLIDFENLVRSVEEEDIDCEAVFRLADEYGRVLVANAYADWRMKDVNQYQTELYGLGIELVHVLGHRHGGWIKNAVDVKMAVDAVSLMSSLPHINVFVIVSGDRDFIHVLKELRRQGKAVIGVSPNSAVSKDFSALCDRFLRYEALTSTLEPTDTEGIEEVRSALEGIVRDSPDGILGSQLKTALRRTLSSTFDESAYGFTSFATFLSKMNDIVRVVPAPADGGDLRVFPISTGGVVSDETDSEGIRRAQQGKQLRNLGYDKDARRRRRVLSRLFDILSNSQTPLTVAEVHATLEADDAEALSWGKFAKYVRILSMCGALVVEKGQDDALFRERPVSLSSGIDTLDSIVQAYETAIVVRLIASGVWSPPFDVNQVCAVLGQDEDSSDDLAYCEGVLEAAMQRKPVDPLGEAAS